MFQVDSQIADVGPSLLALLPSNDDSQGPAGARAQRSGFEPSQVSPMVFFQVCSIKDVITRATLAGKGIWMPKTELPGLGFTAYVGETELGRITLCQLF